MSDFHAMRQHMVQRQLIPEGVANPRLIDAFLTVPRENFVPCQLARIAYMDTHFPLKKGRFLLRPATLGRLLEALNPQPIDKILYIAGGTGYGPALLNQMAAHIVALDEEETFTRETEHLAHELKFSSMRVILGPLIRGWEDEAPYDKILIEGSVDTIPTKLAAQLREGGQLVTIRHRQGQGSTAVKIERTQDVFTEQFLFDAFSPRLKSFQEQKPFVF